MFSGLHAAEILGGQVTAPMSVELKVRYTGGNKPYDFKLENGARAISRLYITGDAKSEFVVDQPRSIGVRQ